MTNSLFRSTFIAAGIFLSGAACSSELPGQWTLTVENPDHLVVATLKVKFTDKQARSCMAGEWKVLKVISATTQEKDFFPTSDALAYRIEDKQLTMGRNEICDAYLWLRGALGGHTVQGDYISFGLGGGTPLGYFNMSPAK